MHRSPQSLVSAYWDSVAEGIQERYYYDALLGEYKSGCFLRALQHWLGPLHGVRILKTDLFEEAALNDQLLFQPLFAQTTRFGIDISPVTACGGMQNFSDADHAYFCICDVRKLPFKDQTFDVIISTSTLDHFADERSFLQSLFELNRVLKPTGVLALFLDNKSYLLRWILNLKSLLGIVPFFRGKTYNVEELETFFHQTHFLLVDSTAVMHVPIRVATRLFRLFSALIGKPLLRFFNCLERVFSYLPSRFKTGAYLAVLAVKRMPK